MDFGQRLPIDVVKSILLEIPLESEIHLVFTNSVQLKYFKGTGYHDWIDSVTECPSRKEFLRSMLVCKLYEDRLMKINGFPWPSNEEVETFKG